MNPALKDLQQQAKTFFASTQKQFSSCRCAYIAVDDFELYSVWGDFRIRKQAIDALRMWALAFRRKANIEVVGNNYRVSVTF